MKITPPSGVINARLPRGYGASYELLSYGETPVVVHAAPADNELEALLKLSCELEFIGQRLLTKSEECRACAQALDLDAKERQGKANPTPEVEEKQVLTRWLNDNVSIVHSEGLYTAWYETGPQLWGEISLCGKPSENLDAALKSLGVTEREVTVLELLAAGDANKEIARKLDISPNTVKTHIASLFAKLEVQRRTQAIQKARELRILP